MIVKERKNGSRKKYLRKKTWILEREGENK